MSPDEELKQLIEDFRKEFQEVFTRHHKDIEIVINKIESIYNKTIDIDLENESRALYWDAFAYYINEIMDNSKIPQALKAMLVKDLLALLIPTPLHPFTYGLPTFSAQEIQERTLFLSIELHKRREGIHFEMKNVGAISTILKKLLKSRVFSPETKYFILMLLSNDPLFGKNKNTLSKNLFITPLRFESKEEAITTRKKVMIEYIKKSRDLAIGNTIIESNSDPDQPTHSFPSYNSKLIDCIKHSINKNRDKEEWLNEAMIVSHITKTFEID